jgi:aminoglycoside phosphotransferase (APT) family kinase protein
VASQFPHWSHLAIRSVSPGGWDNRTFRFGDKLLLRLPIAEAYASQARREHRWLPKLASRLPLAIPEPVALGQPGLGYPWEWSIYRWIEGQTAAEGYIASMPDCAIALAEFLSALRGIDATGGPRAGPQSFYRGCPLAVYDRETREALAALTNEVDTSALTRAWDAALASEWTGDAVWVHGDVSADNLLVSEGQLKAVIDFGAMCVGDPACDLAIAWTFFSRESRHVFETRMDLDAETWKRGRGWALWKALIVAARHVEAKAIEVDSCWHVITEVLAEERGLG